MTDDCQADELGWTEAVLLLEWKPCVAAGLMVFDLELEMLGADFCMDHLTALGWL